MNKILIEVITNTTEGSLTISLEKQGRGMVITRNLLREGGDISMTYPLRALAKLRDFLEADPYYWQNPRFFEQVYEVAAREWPGCVAH